MWRATCFGAPRDVLKLEQTQLPPLKKGILLIKVAACGVGLPDLLMTRGVYPLVPEPPVTPGQEVAGEVVATGAGSSFAVGDRVMGITLFTQGSGGYADYAMIKESRSHRIPSIFTDEEAAGFLIAYRTAYAALVERAALVRNEVLLVLGAAGSSGVAAIQLGKALGATVIAVAGSGDKRAFCLAAGADHVLDYKTCDIPTEVLRITANKGADVIFDPVGGELGTKTLKCIARFGRLALIGFASGSWPTLDPEDMVMRNYSAVGVFLGGFSPAEDRDAFDRLCAMAERGELKTLIGKVGAFADVPGIIHLLESNPPPGKLVVRITAP
jgi:NADPH2:quinone reductase